MITFLDGPAHDVTLALRRAPTYLRVVQARDGTWDALDQLADTPRADETITVYQRVNRPTCLHVCSGRCRVFLHAHYRLVAPQPEATQVRATAAWRDWARRAARA